VVTSDLLYTEWWVIMKHVLQVPLSFWPIHWSGINCLKLRYSRLS
jgi:hypothetical protein